MPFPFRFQMRAKLRPSGLPSGGCIIGPEHDAPRSAGAVEVVTERFTATDAERGRIASIAHALDEPAAEGVQRTAGNPTEEERRRAIHDDATASRTFDPRDPASMTEARWRTMSPEAQRAWIEASAASDEQKRRMIEAVSNGLFGTIREFITSERQKAVTAIEEAARTERHRETEQQTTRRLELTEETRRLDIAARQARDEAAAAERESQNAQNEAERLRRQAEADTARERSLQAQRDADAAAARLAEANAAAERERRESRELSQPSLFATTGGKIVAGLLGAAALGAAGYVAVRVLAPPAPPAQLLPGYAQRDR